MDDRYLMLRRVKPTRWFSSQRSKRASTFVSSMRLTFIGLGGMVCVYMVSFTLNVSTAFSTVFINRVKINVSQSQVFRAGCTFESIQIVGDTVVVLYVVFGIRST